MNNFKTLLIISLLISIAYSGKSLTPEKLEEYRKNVEGMLDLVKQERAILRHFINHQKEELGKKVDIIDEFRIKFEKRSEEFIRLKKIIDEKTKHLEKKVEEYSKVHSLIEKRHEDFMKKLAEKQTAYSYGSEKLNRMYKNNNFEVWDDLKVAKKRIWREYGFPKRSDWYTYLKRKYKGAYMINFGKGINSRRRGLQILTHKSSTVLWLRCANHVWGRFSVISGRNEDLGQFTCGHRKLNEISFDGGAPTTSNYHQWVPIRIYQGGEFFISSGEFSDSWISGIAFSKNNYWNHTKNSAVAYHWAVNGGSRLPWFSHLWMNDNLAFFDNSQIYQIRVPIIENGKDKLLYIVEHNSSWVGTMHTSLWVHGKGIERLRTSYSNPFATHFNSKLYDRYLASFVPANYIPKNTKFLIVTISMMKNDHRFYFREIGTHDAYA